MRTVETMPVVDPTPHYPSTEPDKLYHKILIALDGSEQGERILPHVEALARYTGAAMILLHASNVSAKRTGDSMPMLPEMQTRGVITAADPPGELPPAAVEEMAHTESYLSTLVERLKGNGIDVLTDQIAGDPAEVIIARAREHGVDLIAMTGSSRTGLSRLFSSSVAETVIHNAPCPVLLVSGHTPES